MAATAHADALDSTLAYIVSNSNTTHVDVVNTTWNGTYADISGKSQATVAHDFSGDAPEAGTASARKCVITAVAMGAVGVDNGTTGFIVFHDNTSKVIFSVTATGGAAITTGADVTIGTFEIVNPQPTSA